jgi:hypothetical protein
MQTREDATSPPWPVSGCGDPRRNAAMTRKSFYRGLTVGGSYSVLYRSVTLGLLGVRRETLSRREVRVRDDS